MRRSESTGTPKKEGSKKRKRADVEVLPQDGVVPEMVTEAEQVLEGALNTPSEEEMLPLPKKSKAGRPALPDDKCEHGPSMKSCQKCIYRTRVERVRRRQERPNCIAGLGVFAFDHFPFPLLSFSLPPSLINAPNFISISDT